MLADRSRPAPLQDSQPCQLKLRLPKAVFEPSEPIAMDLEFINKSKRGITVWESSFSLNHYLEVRDQQGNSPPLTARGQQSRRLFSPGRPPGQELPGAPGSGARYQRTDLPYLSSFFRLQPGGAYRARVTYEDGEDDNHLKCVFELD